MASSPSERISALQSGFEVLVERIEGLTRELRDLSALRRADAIELKELRDQAAKHREEAAHFRQLLEEERVAQRERDRQIAELREADAQIRQENAVLRQMVQDHVARYQETDRRRWSLILALVGASLSLAAGLIATLAKR